MIAFTVALVVAAVALALAAAVLLQQPNRVTVQDLRGNAVQLDPGELPVPRAASHATDTSGSRLVVPAVGLNVPIGAIDAVDGQITPPGFASAYWVRNLGVSVDDGTHGTVVVVMHSLRSGGVAPGNYLADTDSQRSKVPIGAKVDDAGIQYTVTGSELVDKSELAHRADIWKNLPNRLLLITCLERPDGTPSTQNLIITSQRA